MVRQEKRNPGYRVLDDVVRETDLHGRPVRLVRGADFLADLRGIAQHEFGGDLGDVIGAAERRFQVDPLVIAEALAEFLHDRDVGAGEPVNRLPVVADRSRRRVKTK